MEAPSVELRGPCPRWIVDMLDAVSGGKRISRTEQVNRILAVWARQKAHEASLIRRVTQGNPLPAEVEWRPSE